MKESQSTNVSAPLPRDGQGSGASTRTVWIATLFAAEEIPASIVTYVAVLMFLQTETSPAIATCYCGLLFLPWVLKSFLRSYVRRKNLESLLALKGLAVGAV